MDWVHSSWIRASAGWIQIPSERSFVLSKGHVWDMDLWFAMELVEYPTSIFGTEDVFLVLLVVFFLCVIWGGDL